MCVCVCVCVCVRVCVHVCVSATHDFFLKKFPKHIKVFEQLITLSLVSRR